MIKYDGFSWREFLRRDDYTNMIYTPNQISDQLTAIVFDLDNTLIDSKAKLVADVVGTFARLGIDVSTEEACTDWYKLAETKGVNKKEFDDAFHQRKTWEQSLADGEVPIFPETYETLDKLKDREIKLALLSKSIPEYTQTKLDYFDLNKYFEEVETVHPKEPSKDPGAIEIVKRLNPEHFETFWFVGDKQEDVVTEKAVSSAYDDYGLATGGIYVNRQGNQLDGYPSVSSLEQILDVI